MRSKKKHVILEDILVEDYAAEGKSLARIDGKVVFIENAVPGDVVDIQLSKSKKDWAEGRAVRIKQYSKDRVDPFCTHFGICGGCNWQMLPYEQQLHYKQKQVSDNLQRIAKVPLPPIMPIAGCDETRHYRNKMEYTFATKRYVPDADFREWKEQQALGNDYDVNRGGAAGFHAKGMFDKIVEIDVCHLQHEPTNEIRKAIAAYSQQKQWPFYDIFLHSGWLRTMQVRMATTGELMVNIVFGHEQKEHRKELLDYVLRSFPQITTLLYTINTKKNDSLYDLHPQVYHGKGYIVEQLEEFRFKIGPKSFFQTNSRQAEKLYQVTRDFAGLNGSQIVYDLYCGTGSIGIFVSNLAKKIVGVEVVAEAIADAKENAAMNGLSHASFYAGDVIDICDDAFFEANGLRVADR